MVGHSLEEDVGSTHITVDDGLVALVQVVQSSGNVDEDREAVFWCQLISLMYMLVGDSCLDRSSVDDERRGLVKHCPNELHHVGVVHVVLQPRASVLYGISPDCMG